jgi:hypothetical protein
LGRIGGGEERWGVSFLERGRRKLCKNPSRERKEKK